MSGRVCNTCSLRSSRSGMDVGCRNGACALAKSGVPTPDNVADSSGNRQAGIGLPLSVLQKVLRRRSGQRKMMASPPVGKRKSRKRIQDKEGETWTNFHSKAPPLSQSRTSCTSRNFQGNQPEAETSNPTTQEVKNCCSRMSGWPWFDGTFKKYPKFKREWERYQQLTPKRGLM
jgi:hypothetical protein